MSAWEKIWELGSDKAVESSSSVMSGLTTISTEQEGNQRETREGRGTNSILPHSPFGEFIPVLFFNHLKSLNSLLQTSPLRIHKIDFFLCIGTTFLDIRPQSL